MPYKPIAPEDLVQPEKMLVPNPGRPEQAKKALALLANVKVYGLLLSADPKSKLAEVVSTRWSELHHLSGDSFAVLAFDAPREWTPALEDYWRKQLGERFDEVWGKWKAGAGLDAGMAFEWRDLFDPPLAARDLPCLVLFTDLDSKNAVVRSIPDWDADAIYRFLMAQFESVSACCSKPPEERLECLRGSVGSATDRLRTYMGHYADSAWTYVKEHPTSIALTTVSLTVALANASVLPLTGTALIVLNVVKDALKKG
jgi:hypothetical protein